MNSGTLTSIRPNKGDEEKQLRVLYFSALFAPLRCNDCDIAPQRSAERRGCRCKNANSFILVT